MYFDNASWQNHEQLMLCHDRSMIGHINIAAMSRIFSSVDYVPKRSQQSVEETVP